ncbi:MAG: PH domain-containing protein [Atopobiaceae bacterium]|nr:PH domain-containing protein [Atopobiaceae bacterium]
MACVASWTFFREVKIPAEIYDVLAPGEVPQIAFKTVRDVAVFTNRRLIVRDSQGITGKKVEQYSLPWDAVDMWSSENAGHLDLDSEIQLWTRAGNITIELKRGADVRAIDRIIATQVFGDISHGSARASSSDVSQAQAQTQQESRGKLGGMNPFKR